ncbi:Type I restriction enzyme EcoKI specificity protein [Serratia marcescens]|uniref:restriction endonuclease subunit S n=1 Tax=Serratia TaxID=613 RepID=UPI000744F63D|nr:type I restriction endonuclease subunit S [Serratia marcescens]PZQ35813.1 MAG: restriction endonuclease subunit S [Serratia marcescens]CVB32109.1 Type I restriction enzyme EcoKI specificity protein [Serratia marcescens]CVG51394.1 Type I restriction enzyme EcoKI specificity protein [Serratia marcescens]
MSRGKLPEGWASAPVSAVTTLIRGVTYKKEQAINYLKDDYLPLIRANNIQNGKFDTTDLVFVPKNLVKESQKISPEDIVIAMSSGSKSVVGKSAHQYIPFECSFGAFCGALRPEKYILPSFIAHFTKSSFYRNKISSLSAGANINNIKPASFDLINIPIPSLIEQKIIAEKLDTLLAQVDSARSRLEQIPQILKRFRQAVLAAATSGKLTEEWRSKNINAPKFSASSDCLKHFRNAKLPVIPESWQWLHFDQIAEIASNLKSPLDFPNTTHIAPNHIESWTGKVFGYQTIFEDGVTSAKHEFYKGQIIYSKIRPYLCKVAIATFDGLCSADMYPINSKIDTHFLFRWMLTTTFTDWASNAESRTVLPKINQKDLSEIPVPTPPLLEQLEIVRRVEQLFAYADTIEKQVNSALTRVNSLTQSIVAKAFRGELTAQWRAENPDLISGENSAAALLEKIKAERAASGGKKNSRKKA